MPPELSDAGTAGASTEDVTIAAGTDAGATDAGDKGAEGDKAGDQPAAKGAEGDKTPLAAPAEGEQKGDADKGAKTIADGKETKEEDPKKGYWPEDWREKLADHLAAGDKKTYDKELRRLQRISDPSGVYGMYRELDNRLNGGGLIKVPGKDAKPEEIEAYRKSLGVPEKPEEYLKDLTLDNGAVIGEADKPMVADAMSAIHKAGATPDVAKAILNWYYGEQEKKAAELDEQDDTFRRESERALKDELGPAFQRTRNAIGPLFATAPGGTDTKNENALISRILGGRTADGRIIGNDPDVIRWLAGMAHEINPAATITEGGDQSGKGLDAELADIQKLRTSDPKKYWSDAVQKRELELITAKEKIQAKA